MRKNTYTPCCLYPNKIVIIDDHHSFASDIAKLLSRNFPSIAFTEPTEAIDYIEQQSEHTPFIAKLATELLDTDAEADCVMTNIDISKIKAELFNPQRFDTVSTIIVDYAMPSMNGIEVCEKLHLNRLKKIMLTAEASKSIAIEAFNKKLIDRFYPKVTEESINQIVQLVLQVQYEYFIELTESIISESAYKQNTSLQCLKDQAFAEYFKQIQMEYNIVEFYLTDINGGFILLDKEANLSYLSIKTDQCMDELLDFAESTDDTPKAILEDLKYRKKVPYFLTEENYQTPPRDWMPFLHPATKLAGDDRTYYVTYIADLPQYKMNGSPITSLEQYLEKLNS